jgi:hypothetical protein
MGGFNHCRGIYRLKAGYRMSLYNTIASLFGDNEKSKKIYKYARYIAITILFLGLAGYGIYRGISVYNAARAMNSIKVWFVSLAAVLAWLYYFNKIRKDKMVNLHAVPNLKGLSFKGLKLQYIELDRDKMFKITFPNDSTVLANFENGEYHILVKNDEWKVVNETVFKDSKEFKTHLEQAMETARSLPFPPEKLR